MATSPYTAQNLKDDAGQFGWTGSQIYDKAKETGIAADQIDQVAGWTPGQSQGWINERGMQNLGGAPSLMAGAQDKVVNASQYTGTTNDFDESKGVEGRVDSIIAKDSPLMQRAAMRANQTMNARGLLNSSMAVGAGQAAVIDAATPIANADAGFYNQQQLANQNALNTAARDNANMRGTLGMEGRKLEESGRQFDVGQAGTNDRFDRELTQQDRQFDVNQEGINTRFIQELAQKGELFAKELDNKLTLAGMDRDTRLAVVAAQTDAQTLIAGNENIANAWGTTMSAIDKIQNNPDLDSATKTQLINNALGGFQAFTSFWQKVSGGAADVSDLLNFGVTSGSGGTDTAGGGATPQQPNTPVYPGGPTPEAIAASGGYYLPNGQLNPNWQPESTGGE